MENKSSPPLTSPNNDKLPQKTIHFDARGNTCPYEAHITPLSLIKKYLVDQIKGSVTRPEIWQNMKALERLLCKFCHLTQYELWISGIYSTNQTDPPFMNLCFCLPATTFDTLSSTEQDMFAAYLLPADQCSTQSQNIRTFFETQHHLYLTILLCPTNPKDPNYEMRKNIYLKQKEKRLKDGQGNPAGFYIFQKGDALYPHENE